MPKSGFVPWEVFNAHKDKDWRTVHHLWPNIRGVTVAPRPKGSVGAHTHVKVDVTDTPWAWGDVSKAGSNLTDLATRQHAGLTDITHSQHHNKTHSLVGVTHTAAGLTIGYVLRASAADAFAWAQLQHGDLGGVTSDLHHAQLHVASHQADGGDPLDNLLLGASPYIKWQSGNLLLQTDEGTNTNTKVTIKGKGTGYSELLIYDEDDAEYLRLTTQEGQGFIHTVGTTPGYIHLQHTALAGIQCFRYAEAGSNPYFYIYGYKTAVGVKYVRHQVDVSGGYNITAEGYITLNTGANENLYWDFGGSQFWRDIGDSNAIRMTLDITTGRLTLTEDLHFGASPHIRQASGAMTFRTNEGVNTNTYVDIKGKGTGYGFLRLYDEDDAEYLQVNCFNEKGYIRVRGTVPGGLEFQHDIAQDIRFWSAIAAGNPYFYIYGFKAADAVKWGRFVVAGDGTFRIDAEVAGYLQQGGTNAVFWSNTDIYLYQNTRLSDDKALRFGTDLDYSIGYHEPTDSLQIVNGATLNSSIRFKLDASGNISLPAVGTLNLGASPLIRQASGAVTFQTNEGTNTYTYLDVKGKGTGIGFQRIYDGDNAEHLDLYCTSGLGVVRVSGTSPQGLELQRGENEDIKCWSLITSGNPYFYIYGYKTAVGVKYLRTQIDTTGSAIIDAELAGYIRQGGTNLISWENPYVRWFDNKIATFGTGLDYSIGYHEPTDSLQIVNGATLNSNIRAKLTSGALWEFHDWVGIGKTPTVALDVDGTIKATQFYLNLGGLLDVTLGSLEEGETIAYDQATAKWIDAWGVEYDNPRLVWKMYTDFFSAKVDANDPWEGASFGGAAAAIAGTSNHPGIVQFHATDTGFGYRFMTALNCILIAGAEHTEFCFKTHTLLNIHVRLGFQNRSTAALPTNGVYIDITTSTLTGKTANNGAGSTTGTSHTLSTNTWYRAKIAVNSDATEVIFILYSAAGNQLWSNTLATNIPTATGREVGHGAIMWVTAAVTRDFDMDMMIATRAGYITR